MSDKPKKIELAFQSRLAAVEHLAPRFFHEALELDYEDSLVTDESDLRDLADVFSDREAAVAAMLDRLEAHYVIDARAANSTRIVGLLEFLESRGVTG